MRTLVVTLMVTLMVPLSASAADPKWTTMLGTDYTLECPFGVNAWCERKAGSDLEVVTTRASECYTEDGQRQEANRACVGRFGLMAFGPVTNYWANSTTPSLWSVSGTPVVSGNQVSDDNPEAQEGVTSACSAGTGPRVVACYLRAGSLSAATLRINTNGTGARACEVTGLTAESRRYECATTIDGSPSFVTAMVAPGPNLGSATGSIFVDQCQCEAAAAPGPRHDCGPTPCSRQGDVHTVSTAGWPVGSGRIDLVYTPAAATVASNVFVFDGQQSDNGLYLARLTSGALLLNARNPGGGNAVTTSVLSWTSSITISVAWSGATCTVSANGVAVGTLADCRIPTAWPPSFAIGSTRGGASQAHGSIRLLRVSE